MSTITDVRPFHRLAVQASVEIVAAVTRDDLRRSTPCAGWNLLDLLAHMTAQHHGFAAAARGDGDSPTRWASDRVADAVAADPGGVYTAAAADVLDAFALDGVLDAPFALPEIGPGATFPGAMAIGFHFVDYVAHGWDVARSIGAPFSLPGDVVAAVLPLVFAVPDGEYRSTDGAPFGPAIAAPDGAADLDRVLSHLGRSPDWKP
ncbi:TIGR03086 family metal-binding protein [Mycobacterium sp. 852002-40037_SCH5390672]|uniref:TIGR03086 family metal-binding protein n=1 Tax=Mycobacterium sp. 852002-40037_SCH5390672 TaxID=1834089 RepID=UPI0018D3BC46|nr:TIGR03086 family metal-binding protein [Mycobacterium sp. 852002-40037_SCH5390672]